MQSLTSLNHLKLIENFHTGVWWSRQVLLFDWQERVVLCSVKQLLFYAAADHNHN